MPEPRIGVIGLGRMGFNIASRLHNSNFSVVGYDKNMETLEQASEKGIDRRNSPGDVVASVDIVISSLPTPEIVQSVYLDKDGINDGAVRNGDVIALDMSTITPDVTRTIARESTAIQFLDAPVSGGPTDCLEGSLVAIVGGDENLYESENIQAILDCLCKQTFHAGEIGSGHTVKLLNNLMSMGNLLLAMEVSSLGVAAGVEGKTLNEILTQTGGSSNQLKKRLPQVLNRDFEPGFTVDLAQKDTNLAIEMAQKCDTPIFLGGLISQFYMRASVEGLGEEDCSSVVKLFEKSIGKTVESDTYINQTFDGY